MRNCGPESLELEIEYLVVFGIKCRNVESKDEKGCKIYVVERKRIRGAMSLPITGFWLLSAWVLA